MNRGTHLFFLTCVLVALGIAAASAQTTNTTTRLSTSTAAICFGQPVTFTAVVTGDGSSTPTGTVAFKDGATVIDTEALDASGQASFTTASLAAGAHSVTAQYSGDTNFNASASSSVSVAVNSAPVVTASPASKAVCAGSAVSFTAAATGSPAPAVQWQVSTDGGANFVNVPSATNPTYTFATSEGDNAKQFRAQFSNTCGLVFSAPATLTVNSLPTGSIAGADAVCAGSVGNLYSGPPGLAGYRWSVTGSASLSGPINAASASVNAGASGTFTLTLWLTNASGCSAACSKTVTLLALPTAVVSGGGGICPGNSTNIQAALGGAGPWTLIWSDGFTQSLVSTSPVTRTVSPTSTTVYTVTSVTDIHCSNSGSGSATVTINTPPGVTANPANKIVCAGSSVSFVASASGSPTPSAQWQVSVDGGATFANIAGATSATYTFTASDSDNGKVFRVLFTNPCGSALSSTASLVVNPVPGAAITADAIVCANSTGNVASVPSAGTGATYTWTVSGGTLTSGQGTSSITYTAGSSGSMNISVTVTTPQGCAASSSQSVGFASQGRSLEAWRSKVPLQWQRSTFNDGDHQYSEGNSIPIRVELTQMCPGASWCVVLRYDFKDGNTPRHFYDFLTTYNSSELTVNGQETNSFTCPDPPTTFPIPMDGSLNYQLPGNFTVYNGAITNVSTYTTINGSTVDKQLVLSGFTTAGGGTRNVLILFGGHLARENEWGPGNGASSFPGASAKVFYQFCGESSFGNFAVNPSGIVKQADLSLTKTATPNPLCAGNTLTYTLVVANSGPNQASPITVQDSLPPGTELSLVNLPQGSYSGTTNLNIALGALGAGSNATITIVVAVNTNAVVGMITNTATVAAGAPADPYMLNNTASAVTMVFPHPTASPLSDLVVCRGDPASFSTIAIGAPPFSYQWTHDGVYLPGATNSIYTIPSVGTNDVGTYCVIVSGQCNGIFDTVTNCASLTLRTNATTSPLSNLMKCPSENATFSTIPGGSGPFIFVWKKDGVPIPGATASAFTVTNVTGASAGVYCVEVAGACGSATSCGMLTVCTNTTATALASQTNCLGQAATLATVASGTGPFTYVWKKDGAILPGETRSSLTIPSMSAAQVGTYSVEVTGHCNSVTNFAELRLHTPTTAAPLVSQTNCPSTIATFTTTGYGDGPFTYQWARNGTPLAGQTANTLTLSSLTAADAGTYSVQVAGLCNSTTNFATLTVNQNVLVAIPPLSSTNCPGDGVSFSVTATGTGPFNYQWLKHGVALPGKTNSSLTLPSVTADDAATYTVTINGACGAAATSDAVLVVNTNTALASPPVSLTNCPGTSATFSTVASGTGPFRYQWYKAGNPLADQTSSSLTLVNVSDADVGTYTVMVSGACGNAVTASAGLSIRQNVSVVTAPVDVTNCLGTTAVFSVSATGTGLTYQWLKGTTPIVGQTNSTLILPAVTAADADTYRVVVFGACGNAVSESATLTVNPPTTADPVVSQTVCPGAALSLSTTAHGAGPFTYKWFKDGKPLPGATTSTWFIPSATVLDDGNYAVIVSGTCNAVTNTARVTVHPPTTATPLANQTLCFGATAIFSTTPAGTGPFSFVWKKNGVALAGQTGDSLAIAHLKAADAGTYSVEISGLCDSVTNSATLAVESDGLLSPATFANPGPITITDFSPANPYPSTVEVSCVPSTVSLLTVTLTNLSHTYASDVDILLVSPNGQAVMLMSDVGGGTVISNATLGFSDAAQNSLPQSTPVTSGIYKPTNYSPDDNMPVPAPLGPYGTSLAAFNDTDPNGTWSLYVVDDAMIDSGLIAGGWSLTVTWGPLPIELSAPILLNDGSSQLTLHAQSGKTYIIEASTDLLTWTPIVTNTLSGSVWSFVDAKGSSPDHKFYRARLQP